EDGNREPDRSSPGSNDREKLPDRSRDCRQCRSLGKHGQDLKYLPYRDHDITQRLLFAQTVHFKNKQPNQGGSDVGLQTAHSFPASHFTVDDRIQILYRDDIICRWFPGCATILPDPVAGRYIENVNLGVGIYPGSKSNDKDLYYR